MSSNQNCKGKLVIVSAPSGCGKTTVVEKFLAKHSNFVRSISCTTRPPRGTEKDGVDYFFVPSEAFNRRKRQGFFLETATVFQRQYGTPKQPVIDDIRHGKSVIVTVDVQGMRQICRNAAGLVPIVSIFILPPSEDELQKRLMKRKTESADEMKRRLGMAKKEMAASVEYDFIVVNKNINETVKEMEEILL